MSLITWVGINHYVDDAHLQDFYASLRPGDVVRLVPEAENFWDKRAVAVYHNFLMRGYISRHETEQVHEMVKYGQELIGRITDDIDEEVNQVKISVENVAVNGLRETVYPVINKAAIGMTMNPHIMHEEVSYDQIHKVVETCVHNIRTNDLQSDIVRASVEMIRKAMDAYLGIWDRSLSRQANILPRYFDSLLTSLSKVSKEISVELMPIARRLRRCAAKQSKMEQNMKTFQTQIEALDKEYAKENGFYAAFDEKFYGKTERLQERLEKIRQWLNALTDDEECSYADDFPRFVHLLYCNGYRARDLYMIITHLLVMQHIMEMLCGRKAGSVGMANAPVLHVHMEGGTFVRNQFLTQA